MKFINPYVPPLPNFTPYKFVHKIPYSVAKKFIL